MKGVRGLEAGAVIYQIYPRSFCDSDGDGVGDLPGITSKLGYVASLGVDAIWLSPVFPSPMADFGYDVSDYCDIDPLFGTLADFDALVAEAHRLGLKVLLDQVYCHTSDRHAWFDQSRAAREGDRAEWYVWADAQVDGTPPNNWQSVFYGPAWTWDARRSQYYLHNFLPEQPQLNAHLPEVQDALLDVARFWLERGVDGFRLDAINFLAPDPALIDNPPRAGAGGRPFDRQDHLHNQSQPLVPQFLERLRALADGYGAFLLAEAPGERGLQDMKLYMAGRRVHTAYSFDFLSAPALDSHIARAALAPWADGWPAWAFSNHDAPRAVSRWAGDRDEDGLARTLLLLLLSLKGYVCLYQGEELGLSQGEVPFERLRDPEAIRNWPQTFGRDGARTPFPWIGEAPNAGFTTGEPWLPVDPRHVPRAVAVQEREAGSTLGVARGLLALRRDHEALRCGAIRFRDDAEGLLAFERIAGSERLICLFNLTRETVPLPADLAGRKVVYAVTDGLRSGVAPMVVAPGEGLMLA